MDRREFTKVAGASVVAVAAGKVGVDWIEGRGGVPDQAAAPQAVAAAGAVVGGVAAAGTAAAGSGTAPTAPAAPAGAATLRPLAKLIRSQRTMEGAGFPVRRPFPTAAMRNIDPFVLLDEMGPIDWAPGKALGAPAHQHRGFETVSYILQGGVEHADSLGHRGSLRAGDVQWMTAGRGIVHAEMPPAEMRAAGGRMHGFQIWVNLPKRLKMTEPRYQEVLGSDFPEARSAYGLAKVRVIAGSALGVNARIDVHTPIVYQHWVLQPGAQIDQPIGADHNACLYVFAGAGSVGAERSAVADGEMAIFGAGDTVRMAVPADAKAPMQALLLAGVPHGDPIVQYGPLVMNDMDEIKQAFADYRAGNMGQIQG